MLNHQYHCALRLFLAISLILIQVACAAPVTGPDQVDCAPGTNSNVITSPFLSVLTLNLAHGRKDAFNQMFQKTETTRRNLKEIADFFSSSGADVIALQEADAPSRWSGKFNHVDFIADNSIFPCRLHARHASKYMYDFGTALLSSVPYTDSLSHSFEPSPPTTTKGFVMGEVLWNPDGKLTEAIAVSVISVHLDFSRRKIRDAQIAEIQAIFPDLKSPTIILGDFNADWTSKQSAIKAIVEKGNFSVYQPESTELGTYKDGKHRLDWILISNDLEFVSYKMPKTVYSDHQPVQATLKLVDISEREMDSNQNNSAMETGHE